MTRRLAPVELTERQAVQVLVALDLYVEELGPQGSGVLSGSQVAMAERTAAALREAMPGALRASPGRSSDNPR